MRRLGLGVVFSLSWACNAPDTVEHSAAGGSAFAGRSGTSAAGAATSPLPNGGGGVGGSSGRAASAGNVGNGSAGTPVAGQGGSGSPGAGGHDEGDAGGGVITGGGGGGGTAQGGRPSAAGASATGGGGSAGDAQEVGGAAGSESDSTPVAIAVIGASSAAGKNLPEGGYSLSDSWVNRYLAYLVAKRPGSTITNLAVSGTSTFHALPTGTQNPSDQPAVDPAHNVSAALATFPDAIIVSFPSQGLVEDGLADTVLANLQTIASAAAEEGVPVWASTNQPNKNTLASIPAQLDYRDRVLQTFGSHGLDFWTPLADANGAALRAYLNPYDDVHPSAEGHRVLFEQVVAAHLDDAVAPP